MCQRTLKRAATWNENSYAEDTITTLIDFYVSVIFLLLKVTVYLCRNTSLLLRAHLFFAIFRGKFLNRARFMLIKLYRSGVRSNKIYVH